MSGAVRTDSETLNRPCREVACPSGTPSVRTILPDALEEKRYDCNVSTPWGRCQELRCFRRCVLGARASLWPWDVTSESEEPRAVPSRCGGSNVGPSLRDLPVQMGGGLPAWEGSEFVESLPGKMLIH